MSRTSIVMALVVAGALSFTACSDGGEEPAATAVGTGTTEASNSAPTDIFTDVPTTDSPATTEATGDLTDSPATTEATGDLTDSPATTEATGESPTSRPDASDPSAVETDQPPPETVPFLDPVTDITPSSEVQALVDANPDLFFEFASAETLFAGEVVDFLDDPSSAPSADNAQLAANSVIAVAPGVTGDDDTREVVALAQGIADIVQLSKDGMNDEARNKLIEMSETASRGSELVRAALQASPST